MSNTRKAFKNGKAFIPFITCGDPDIGTSEKLIFAMERAGADLIEIGIPFSDPTAEGPVIMAANERALSKGVTTEDVFALVARVRKKTDIPLAFMTYANVVFSRGIETFLSRMATLQMDALILPDVPYEEKGEFECVCKRYGVDLISLVAPTSNDRALTIAKEAEGFLYCVSSLGVTGERKNLGGEIGNLIARIKQTCNIPCAIGFGVSTPEQVKSNSLIADGVIVGSAIVRLIAEHGSDSVPYVEEYVRSMKSAQKNL